MRRRSLYGVEGDARCLRPSGSGSSVKSKADYLELHPDQRSAVLELLRQPVSLLTGGPGVGKTTIVQFVAQLAEAGGAEVLLASPTGRAAKRLSEATGRPASTLHRLLKFIPGEGGFEHGPDRPLEGGLVIVDEVSMLDAALARRLVDAVASPTRLVLVGDPDQLPSVGAGNVLADAGMVVGERVGRERRFTIRPDRIRDASVHLQRISAQWDAALERLRAMVED